MNKWLNWHDVNLVRILVICLLVDIAVLLGAFILWVLVSPEYAMGFFVAVVMSSAVACLFQEMVKAR